ncbi:hypothetical protein [Dactylosporangium sp. NPDC005555]|uniref:hypothetical protein n=1 Tax=Dactylosporangium sp. NPDC005555 TaxID=3154889 RepID=UPI0033A4B512
MTDHGVDLVTRALGRPLPFACQRQPGPPADGDDLPASLRFWLARDATLFDMDAEPEPRLPIGDLVEAELGEPWGEMFQELSARFPSCVLLPGGSDSRRVLALGHPDGAGESAVFAVDCDDMPFIGLMYPGFDCYIADAAGLLRTSLDGYLWPVGDRVYEARAKHHRDVRLGGATYLEFPF